MATSRTAIGANGLPLNVMGQVDLDICLGNFWTVHTFIVVRDLTFECILGADFLKANKAVMDFRNNTLHLGNSTIKIPSSDVSVSSNDAHSISVHALEDMDIPGRSVRLVIATLQKGSCGSTEQISEGLIEPATVLPKHLCVARSLGRVLSEGSILVQVMNVSPTAVKVYKGIQLGQFVPQRNLILMESNVATVGSGNRREVTTFNLDSTEITDSEKHELRNLLRKFDDLFVSENGALGRTKVVKHRINTSGSPIRQPLRRQPESLKGDMNEEVKKMLSRGVIRPSSSPWSSPVVMVRKKNGSGGSALITEN